MTAATIVTFYSIPAGEHAEGQEALGMDGWALVLREPDSGPPGLLRGDAVEGSSVPSRMPLVERPGGFTLGACLDLEGT